MEKKSEKRFNMRAVWGILIIVIGVVFLVNELGLDVSVGEYWPVFLLLPGLFFWMMFLSKREQSGIEGVLIPGTILTLLGAYFFYMNAIDWKRSSETSFIYTLIVSLAFFSAYYFGNKARGYIIPAWILLAISAIVFFATVTEYYIWPIVLIIFGVWLLFKPRNNR